MADTEEYFPRGGKKPTVQYFKQSSNFLGTAEKGEKKKSKPKKKSEADDGYLSDEGAKHEDNSYLNCAVGLSYKTVRTGCLVLGRVSNIYETKVKVMLPGKTQGMVMACHVSEPYNKLIEAYVNNRAEKIKELTEMFRAGQYVAVKVLETDGDHLMLTMMPQHVNGGKNHSDLHNGCLLQAAVSSVEDHGYVMDIGISNTRAFLPKKNTNPELELETGMLTWCCVKSVAPSSDNSIVTLSNHLDNLQAGVQRKSNNSGLLPATAVDFVVDKPLDNGIEGHIFADTTAYVQRQHADKVKGKKPTLGQRVRARVLYVIPTRNTPFLTLKNIFETTYPDLSAEQKFKEGDIIEEAQVIRITGRSIHFKLARGSVGTLSLKLVQVDEDLSDEQVLAKSYPVGSTHKLRVLCYNLSDYQYSVTDQASIVNEKYFSLQQLSAGQLVPATVKVVTDNHVGVSVGRVSGFIPQTHLSDAGIFIDPKKATNSKLPKKKFKVGQEIKARVLSVDHDKQTLLLTAKPSLLAEDLEVLSGYEQAEIGKAYTGVIKKISEYLLVSFFNNVTAFVPRVYVTKDTDVVLNEAFHIGQIVKCTVLKVDPEAKKMTGSLTTVPFWPEKKREFSNKRKIQSQDDDTTEPAPKKKKGKKQQEVTTEQKEIDHKKDKKKKRDKNPSESEDNVQTEVENTDKVKKKKDKKSQLNEETETVNKKQKGKKSNEEPTNDATEVKETEEKHSKRKRDKKASQSEESDAIETDFDDKDMGLTPEDLGLIDLSDCTTAKKCKKRIVSLLKSIKARTTRTDKIDQKIRNIESRGLNPKTKKFHTAMHMEKLVIELRITRLLTALKDAQEKLKEFGDDDNKDYKKKKDVKEKKVLESEQVHVKGKVKVGVKVLEGLEPALEVPSAKEFWSASAEALSKNVQEESSSSEDEDQEQPKKKRKKLSVAEKVAKVRAEEERVREMERRAVESESQPRSSEQFERALLAHPDSSQLWIAYMAFHLQATEIEKARAVCRKALNTINFREELERLNVWLAWLNCEHRFGTKETQQKVLEEALQMNDTFKVHSKLLDILVETAKHQELSSLVDLMLRKYKQNPQNYILCGGACFKLGLVEKARQVMQKAVAVLEKKEHVSLLVQFALMERSSGAADRAEALFEQVLAVYPRRVDVSAVYADMLLKGGDAERVRQVMERMTSQKLPARKMKILYKKWIEVEEKLGDKEQVELIRQKAMEFIDKAKF